MLVLMVIVGRVMLVIVIEVMLVVAIGVMVVRVWVMVGMVLLWRVGITVMVVQRSMIVISCNHHMVVMMIGNCFLHARM
jgi:hypothetical protein